MTEVSAIAPNKDSSGVESGSVPMHSDPNAVEWALINRKQLQLIIQAYDLLVSCWATGEGGLSPEVTSCADFVGGPLFLFGPFRLLPSQRLLLEGNRRIQIGVRAFDILTILVERAGELVGKDELFARVWPNVFVADSNLKVQVSLLRRALGEAHAGRPYVVTVPGRGYNFVAPVIGLAETERGVLQWRRSG
jgi:DNA-binding winged helix-turn-helix (wHTH) protein